MMSEIIQLKDVRKIYGSGNTEVRALDGVDLQISAGEFVSVMGPSGSGKSTCMNIVGCLDTPTSGSYFFSGLDIAKFGRDELALLRRHYLGFVFQSFNLLARTTAVENVELPLIYQGVGRKERRDRAMAALESVGIGERWDHTPSELSGGQQQRVAIARALVTRPTVLVADEPTGNLDTTTTQEVIALLGKLNDEGLTIVMVTHEPEVAIHTKRALWFVDGKLVKDGLPREVLA
ncbi:ABC transporter ATP-binding protein [Microvenator marinus]|jgi:putative ABC transport system ATP-binding protein|uniref:ABC transporter ATP-binding protein n=1 Tax=Microvenator marinus TaxID=2600177 RepID=A0A5B8XNW6_9DELT|nr:ABC transporter ATP-binding protein [Microvenator marinus]QED26837.1 ABC transporter ATP-binding protein [Microvenator marinus]